MEWSVPCRRRAVLLSLIAACVAGCQPAPSAPFSFSEATKKLKPEVREKFEQYIAEHTGSPESIKLIGHPEAKSSRLVAGYQVYSQRCVQCHGVSGDGNGPSAGSLFPRPRDYRKGIFKFTSTPYGIKPARSDLVETVRRGISGTSMPSFHLLPDADVQAVVDYVIALSQRGELELQMAGDQGQRALWVVFVSLGGLRFVI
jgi:cytochrome c553